MADGNYQVLIYREAQKQLARLNKPIRETVYSHIVNLKAVHDLKPPNLCAGKRMSGGCASAIIGFFTRLTTRPAKFS